MRKIIAVAAVLVATSEAPAAQAVWNAEDLGGGGAEFRLGNGEGAAIILVCQRAGVSAGFEFPAFPEPGDSASLRGLPGGERQNVTVAPVNDHVFRLTSGRGIEVLLGLLGGPPILDVRAGGTRASFQVFGSAPVVHQCLDRQDEELRAPGRWREVRRVRNEEDRAERLERQALAREQGAQARGPARERRAQAREPVREPAPE